MRALQRGQRKEMVAGMAVSGGWGDTREKRPSPAELTNMNKNECLRGMPPMTEDDFLQAIAADPGSAATASTWLVLADWLEENGQTERAELVRLQHDRGLRPEPDARVRELLAAGVAPVVPTLVNSIGMRFVQIPAGTFLMGSPKDEEGRHGYEWLQHEVEITQPFWMGAFPVTQQEYERVTGANPSHFSKTGSGKKEVKRLDTSRFPVESVSSEDAVAFCAQLSSLPDESATGRVYRLPTEAEWEYACRAGAGDGAPFHFGWTLCSEQANFHGNHPYGGASEGPNLERTTAVGSFTPNAWGLYDMHGNVGEWCADRHDDYPAEAQADPTGPTVGDVRVLRGGSWSCTAEQCRAAYRLLSYPSSYFGFTGFRVCFHLGRP
jgi:uncharacterized protein (TIGR02996 family)